MPAIGKSYAPIGKPAVLSCDVKNKKWLSISAVIASDGYLYYEIRESEGFKGGDITKFLDNVVADSSEKVLVIWDNSPVHTSKEVKAFCQQNAEDPQVWLANIPPYSPELNPIEQLWSYLKQQLANKFHKTTKELKESMVSILEEIKKTKNVIKNLFNKKNIKHYSLT